MFVRKLRFVDNQGKRQTLKKRKYSFKIALLFKEKYIFIIHLKAKYV